MAENSTVTTQDTAIREIIANLELGKSMRVTVYGDTFVTVHRGGEWRVYRHDGKQQSYWNPNATLFTTQLGIIADWDLWQVTPDDYLERLIELIEEREVAK